MEDLQQVGQQALLGALQLLELLQAGRDPSPPQLPLVFYRNLDGERTVKVARSQLPA